MSSPQPLWQRLIALIESDKQVHLFSQQRDALHHELAAQKKHLLDFQVRAENVSTSTTQAADRVQSTEDAIKKLEARTRELSRALDACRNPRELRALEGEQAALSREHIRLEEALLSAWHEREQKLSEQKKLTSELQDFTEQHAALEHKIAQQLAAIDAEQQTYESTIDTLVAQLPAEWQSRYRQLRGRVHNPIVPVTGESCSACYQYVRATDLQRLRRGALLPCIECHRYLYVLPKESTQPVESNPQPLEPTS